MCSPGWRAVCVALLVAFAPAAHALVFAVDEGVTYRVPFEEVRGRYALIAADLAKILKQPVTVEPIADYPSLRKGLAEKAYDLAMVHPAHLSIQAIKRSGYQLVAVTKGYQSYTSPVPGRPRHRAEDARRPQGEQARRARRRLDHVGHGAGDLARCRSRHHPGVDGLHALPGRRAVLRREPAHAFRRHGREQRHQGVDRQGRQGARQVAARADQAHHRQPEPERRAGRERARVPGGARHHRGRPQEARAHQVQRVRALRPGRDAEDRNLARL